MVTGGMSTVQQIKSIFKLDFMPQSIPNHIHRIQIFTFQTIFQSYTSYTLEYILNITDTHTSCTCKLDA